MREGRTTPTEIYEATQLNVSRHEIRLMTLHQGFLADEIRCSQTRVSPDNENDY